MKALLTGGTGFVGQHLARHLMESGWLLSALVRPKSDPARVNRLAELGCEIRTIDDTTSSTVKAVAAARADVIFHLATQFVGEHGRSDIENLIASNVLFGARVLEGIREAACGALVCVGTHWQHFANVEYSPVSLYASTKQAFEDVARHFAEVAAVPVISLHLTDCYGPDDRRQKLVHLLLEAERTGIPLDLSPGGQFLDLLHVSDVVRALEIAGQRTASRMHEPFFEWFSVRSGRFLTVREFVALVERVRGVRIPVRWGARPYRARETFEPWTYGALLPGWSAVVTLEDGLRALG